MSQYADSRATDGGSAASRYAYDSEAAASSPDEYAPLLPEEPKGRSWPSTARHLGISLLPSFMHGFFAPRSILPGDNEDHLHTYNSPTERRKSTGFLDGMRGLAAVCVCISHFNVPFSPNIFYAYGGVEGATLLQLPVVRLYTSGNPMVCIFFVISGVALSLKPASLLRKRRWDDFYLAMESSTFRRGLRLFLPSLFASFLFLVATRLHLCDVTTSVKWEGYEPSYTTFWITLPKYIPSFRHQVADWFHFVASNILIPSIWRTTLNGQEGPTPGVVRYGFHFWTIGMEFWASIVLFAALNGTARLQLNYKVLSFVLFGAISMWIGRWDMVLFLYGSMMAHTSAFTSGTANKSTARELSFIAVFCLGLYIASVPDRGGKDTPAFKWLFRVHETARYWESLGAAMIVTAAGNTWSIRKVFSSALFEYFGRISYAFYIMHVPLLQIFGWRLVPFMWRLTGRDHYLLERLGRCCAFLIFLVVLVWLSDLFYRYVDKPCMSFARRLESRLRIKEE